MHFADFFALCYNVGKEVLSMLNRYRFDLHPATQAETEKIVALIDQHAWTGAIIVSPSIFDGFFEDEISVEELIPLPAGCTMTKQ